MMKSNLMQIQNKLAKSENVISKKDQTQVKGGAGATEYIIMLVLIA